MKRYRKKPVTIEAVKWTGNNISEICNFAGMSHLFVDGQLYIQTLEGVHHASVGDYIIKGVRGEFYPCKPDIFHETYREVYESGGIDCMYATFEEMNAKIDRLNGVMKIVGDDYDLDRLRELVEADRDGRCFIASIKIGERVFLRNDKKEIIGCRVQGISLPVHGKDLIIHLGGYPAEYLWADREGIDWWKTREAAEAALKGEQDERTDR